MKTILSNSAGGGLALLIALTAMSASAAPASASPDDEAVFVQVLTDQGIVPKYYGADEAVVNGHAICVTMDKHGFTQTDMVDAVSSTDGLAPTDAAFVVGAATAAFCPEFDGS